MNYMETNYPAGYFLMIEGAKIDKASHSNDIQAMLKNMADFSSAIKAVDEKQREEIINRIAEDYTMYASWYK